MIQGELLCLLANVHPGMDVRFAAEIPEHGWSFNLPNVPNPIVADVVILVKSHVQIVEAICLNQFHGFVCIAFAERSEQIGHYFVHQFFLIAREFGHSNPREAALLSCEPNCIRSLFFARFLEQRDLALFAIEHFENFVCAERLEPISVPLVVGLLIEAFGGVPIKDWATESSSFNGVTIAAARAMPARQHEFEFAGAGLSKERDGTSAKSLLATVVDHLGHHALCVIGTVQ